MNAEHFMDTAASAFVPYQLQVQRTIGGAPVEDLLRASGVRALPARLAYLVNSETGTPFAPFLEYVAQTALTRSQLRPRLSKSLQTVEAYAGDLSDFFGYLDAAERKWEEADEIDAYAYIDSMIEHPSPATGRPYANETIRRRISSLKSFYEWAGTRGRVRSNLKLVDPSESLHARRYEGGPGNVEKPAVPPADREVRPIPPAELQSLMNALGPDTSLRELSEPQDRVSVRNRLMAECAYHIGLRRAEVVGLQAAQIMKLTPQAGSPYSMHPIEVFGKGAKWRTVNIPAWLAIGLQRYYIGPRAAELKETSDHGYLFVAHSAARPGLPLSDKHFDDLFAAACMRAGLHNASNRDLAKYTVHHLRHNFALATYFSRKANGDQEPWLYIQAMLGHAYVETTLRIYLRAAKALESTYSDYFNKALQELIGNA